MMPGIETAILSYADLPRLDLTPLSEGARQRAFGVQILALDEDGNLFMRHDLDGHKEEGHVLTDRVVFSNARRERFNSSSGGGGLNETLEQIAAREIDEELRGCRLGEGPMEYQSQVPGFVCYQGYPEKKTGRVLLGVAVHWYPSLREIALLAHHGHFWRPDTLVRTMDKYPDHFRPAFRHVVRLYAAGYGPQAMARVTAEYNTRYMQAILDRRQDGVMIDLGLFGLNGGNHGK